MHQKIPFFFSEHLAHVRSNALKKNGIYKLTNKLACKSILEKNLKKEILLGNSFAQFFSSSLF